MYVKLVRSVILSIFLFVVNRERFYLFLLRMGVIFFINWKDLFYEYFIWNIKVCESVKLYYCKCCYYVNSDVYVKENKVL